MHLPGTQIKCLRDPFNLTLLKILHWWVELTWTRLKGIKQRSMSLKNFINELAIGSFHPKKGPSWRGRSIGADSSRFISGDPSSRSSPTTFASFACWSSNSFNDKAKTACNSSSSLVKLLPTSSFLDVFVVNPPTRIKLPRAFSAAAWPLRLAPPKALEALRAAALAATAVRRALSAAAALAASATAPAWCRIEDSLTLRYCSWENSPTPSC